MPGKCQHTSLSQTHGKKIIQPCRQFHSRSPPSAGRQHCLTSLSGQPSHSCGMWLTQALSLLTPSSMHNHPACILQTTSVDRVSLCTALPSPALLLKPAIKNYFHSFKLYIQPVANSDSILPLLSQNLSAFYYHSYGLPLICRYRPAQLDYCKDLLDKPPPCTLPLRVPAPSCIQGDFPPTPV